MLRPRNDPVLLRAALSIAIGTLEWYAAATPGSRAKVALEKMALKLEEKKTTKETGK